MEIKKTEHCLLCEHQQRNIKVGVYCGITELKPEFDKTCPIISFGKIMENKIVELNVEQKLVEKTKGDTFGHLVIFTLIGVAVLYIGVFLVNTYWLLLLGEPGANGAMGLIPMVFLVFIGIGILIFAIAPLNLYRQNLKIAKSKKGSLDALLKEYNLTYTIDLIINKHWAGHFEVDEKLQVYSIKQKGRHVI